MFKIMCLDIMQLLRVFTVSLWRDPCPVNHRLLGKGEETRKCQDTIAWSAHQTRDLSRIGEGAA